MTQPFTSKLSELQHNDLEQLKCYWQFASAKNLKHCVESLRTELGWGDEKIVTWLLLMQYQNRNGVIIDLLSKKGVLAAAAFLSEGKHDRSDPSLIRLLTDTLLSAAKDGETESVKLLCESGVNPNSKNIDGTTAIHSASKNGHYSTVEYLIKEAKVDVNITDRQFNTALHEAARNGHTDIVKLLCESGLDPNSKNSDGTTALHSASSNGHNSTVEYLVKEAKADMDLAIKINYNALHKAQSVAEINKRNIIVLTPLHWASAYGHVSTVDLLLKMGADKTINAINGRIAREVAGEWCDDAERKQQIKSFWANIK